MLSGIRLRPKIFKRYIIYKHFVNEFEKYSSESQKYRIKLKSLILAQIERWWYA
jgi:hypothetical protein